MQDLLTGRLQMDRSVVECSVIPSQSDERGSAAAAVAADMWQPPGSQHPCMMISISAKCIPWRERNLAVYLYWHI